MVLKCQVYLDNAKSTYEPGDRLTGRVLLTLGVRLLIKAVAIKYTGFAEVKWERLLPPKKAKKMKQKGDSVQASHLELPVEQCIEVYSNREDFLSNVTYFVGSEEATARIIERGTYTYLFTVALPQSCPSTFESANGHIRYMLEVFIDHKNKRDVWYTQQLQVLKPLKLRRCPQVAEQARDVLVKEDIPWCFFKHPLKMCVNLQQFGFVPGEVLSIHVSIQNSDNLHLHEVTYELEQICRITAAHGHNKTKTKYFRTILAKAVHNLCGPREMYVQHLQILYMPQTVPNTDPADCQCLQISYELSVRLSTDNAKRSVQAKIPIVVGTVRLRTADEARAVSSTLQPGVFVSNSIENLSSKLRECNTLPMAEPQAGFGEATAPEPESPMRSTLSLSFGSSSYREAAHLPTTKFDAERKKSKYKKAQTDFQPTYLYYDIDSMPGVQNAAASTTTATTTACTTAVPSTTEVPQRNASEDYNPENNPYAGVVQELKREMQERKSIVDGSS